MKRLGGTTEPLLQVGLFITCLTDTFYPRVGMATVAVLRHFGCDVNFSAAQTCCGQPAYTMGLASEAARLAARLPDIFASDPCVVSPSASCTKMIKHHAADLFEPGSAMRASVEAFAAKLYDLNSFLTDVLEVDLAQFADAAAAPRTTFHYPCHNRGLASCDVATARARALLGRRFEPLERADQCCGFGGSFAVDFDEISGAMLSDKLACLQHSRAEVLLCDDAGCRLNIAGGLHRRGGSVRVVHTAELIAEALGLRLPEDA